MANWVGRVLAGLAVLTIALSALTVWLVSQETTIESKIPVVQRIGSPCRTAFARGGLKAVRNDYQCTLQASLIFTNLCDHHPIIPACSIVIGKRKGVAVSTGNSNSPSGLPGPSGGLNEPQKAPEKPQEPPPAPRTPVPPLDLNKTICGVTGALNVSVCN